MVSYFFFNYIHLILIHCHSACFCNQHPVNFLLHCFLCIFIEMITKVISNFLPVCLDCKICLSCRTSRDGDFQLFFYEKSRNPRPCLVLVYLSLGCRQNSHLFSVFCYRSSRHNNIVFFHQFGKFLIT